MDPTDLAILVAPRDRDDQGWASCRVTAVTVTVYASSAASGSSAWARMSWIHRSTMESRRSAHSLVRSSKRDVGPLVAEGVFGFQPGDAEGL
jgi:hypothetical protein